MCQMLKLVKANVREMMWRSSPEFDSQVAWVPSLNLTSPSTYNIYFPTIFFFFGGGQLVRKGKKEKEKRKEKTITYILMQR
jgi:hypothetical protein